MLELSFVLEQTLNLLTRNSSLARLQMLVLSPHVLSLSFLHDIHICALKLIHEKKYLLYK